MLPSSNSAQMIFLLFAFITAPGNLYCGFHISHKWLETKLVESLEDKPYAEEMKPVKLGILNIIIIQPEVILYFVMHHRAITVIVDLQ